jgi:predicted signal transduction protein with EAL and GGDEF domain
LRLGAIAEGVEQLALLRELGCVRAQGFYFARPVPGPEAARLILESATMPGARRPPLSPLRPTGACAISRK